MNSIFMERVFELAEKGSGWVNPNPLVGAVIEQNGRIIGEGYHAFYGGLHAEAEAIKNATEDVKGSTLYVNLEPCAHFGKQPPCCELIVKKKISKVVIALEDPNPLVAGKGIRYLRERGVIVELGLRSEQARRMNEVFIKYIQEQKPFVLLKGAMTLDGKIATVTGESRWISNGKARKKVHDLRQKFSAVMVGINTVLADDPALNVRNSAEGLKKKDPLRIVLDSSGKIPLTAKVLNITSNNHTLVVTTEKISDRKREELESVGAEVLRMPGKKIDLKALMTSLGERKIDSILLEGGGTLNYHALEADIVDKLLLFIAPKILGGQQAKSLVAGPGVTALQNAFVFDQMDCRMLDDNLVIEAERG